MHTAPRIAPGFFFVRYDAWLSSGLVLCKTVDLALGRESMWLVQLTYNIPHRGIFHEIKHCSEEWLIGVIRNSSTVSSGAAP